LDATDGINTMARGTGAIVIVIAVIADVSGGHGGRSHKVCDACRGVSCGARRASESANAARRATTRSMAAARRDPRARATDDPSRGAPLTPAGVEATASPQ